LCGCARSGSIADFLAQRRNRQPELTQHHHIGHALAIRREGEFLPHRKPDPEQDEERRLLNFYRLFSGNY
jgi:hypothetical protein